MLFICFALGGVISSFAYSLRLVEKDQEFLARTYSRSALIVFLLMIPALHFRLLFLVLILVFLLGAQILPLFSLCNIVLASWRSRLDLTKSFTLIFLISQFGSSVIIFVLQSILSYFLETKTVIFMTILIVSILLLISANKTNFYT